MAAANYERALSRLLKHEGGYTNHPKDPGGPTNYGITIIDYRKYVMSNATAEDVKNMKLSEAKAIYRAKYWDALCCDDLPSGVDDVVFDYGVNSGIGRSGKVLRRCLRMNDSTWKVTAEVLAKARDANPKQLVTDICDERMRFLRGLSTWGTFGKGWSARVRDVKAIGLALVDGPAAPAKPEPTAEGAGKGRVAIPDGSRPVTGTTIGAIGAAISQRIYEAGYGPEMVVAAIVGTALAVGFGVAMWHWWARQKQEAPA